MPDDYQSKRYDLDRPRGILTPEDRKYLLGETEYENQQSARRTRARIRERVENAFLDFTILQYLEARDRDQIFEADTDERRTELGAGFSSAFIFLYDALVRSREDYTHVDLNFQTYLEQAVEHVDRQNGYRSDFSMDINREELDDPEDIFQRAKEEGFDTLNAAELELLWESDDVDAANLASFMNQTLERVSADDFEPIRAIDIIREREAREEWEDHMDDIR